MNSLTRISRRLCQELIIRLQSTAATSSSSDIYIPNRKERGPTDILKALESTISRDYTAPHYKFHDDPYLMPLSRIQNRSYALAREAGKKAAMWVRQEHSNLFYHKVAEPEIKAFVPPPVYTEKSVVTEETLLYEISNCNVSDAITIYDLLKVDITIPTKQALLELLCFYNNSQPINTDLLEYRWYQTNKRDKNIWITRPQINVLFDFLIQQEPKVAAAAYDAMICGLAKYFSIDKAWHLYQECQKKRLPLSVRGYNAMISLVQFVNREGEKSRTFVKDIYKTMAENGVTPNIYTFNAVLNIAASLSSKKEALDFTRNILADIEYFQLKPSLTTYYYLLCILSKFDDSAYNSFVQILRSLKKEIPVVQNAKDMDFFVTAMNMSRQFCDRQLGEAVNELLLTGDNYKFIGNNYNESNYYRAYLELILATENFDVFFKIYNKLVPHVTIPEPSVMLTILETLGCYAAEITMQYIPKIWSHMIMFGHLDREDLLECLLNLMSVHCKPTTDSPLNAQFAEIALTIWDHIQSRNNRRIQHTIVNSTIMGDIAVLLVRGGNIDKTMDVIMSWTKSPHLITGSVAIEHINEIFEVCLAQGHAPVIFAILEYVISLGLEEVGDMAKKFHQTIPLTSTQENLLISLVGDILNLPLSKEQQSSA
ncbi:protein PTCD3 homolog, mitochondrial isoform X2 [Odontomachus brunneus]|uniref:protein PTCD3 homolog, mitochondrial isoform X2 n=1 Tax=Odontomachus brunneus TaxID=486640 RepID=UPI0013F2465E|nr:protein PTCD3 homolog, mitochondrial isoform X2 [Odontomachus brunneus]